MLTVRESAALSDDLDAIAARIRRGECVVRNLPGGVARQATLHGLGERLDGAVTLTLRAGADQTEAALLQAAAALGDDVTRQVAPLVDDDPVEATRLLDAALGGRPLLVAGEEHLGDLLGDPTLDRVRSGHTAALRDWVARNGRLRLGLGLASAEPPSPSSEPPLQLVNGTPLDAAPLWSACGRDVDRFHLALAAMALTEETESRWLAEGALRRDVLAALADEESAVLQALALHGAELPDPVLRRLLQTGDPGDHLEPLVRAGLARRTALGTRSLNRWAQWMRAHAPDAVVAMHRRLAGAFRAMFDDAGRPDSALHALSAVRHFLAAGETGQALALARRGSALLIAHARDLSIRATTPEAYARAARVYESILGAALDRRLHLPTEFVGYARHYLHYNRAKADLEPLESTARGFRASVEEWAEPAIFWSRLARTRIYQGRTADGLAVLDEAARRVPPHPNKDNVLIARTVRGLLRQQPPYIPHAVEVWGGFQPRDAAGRHVERELARALDRGWTVELLRLPDAPDVVFRNPQQVRVVRVRRRWQAQLSAVRHTADAASPREALVALAHGLRARVEALVKAYTHELDAEGRFQKQLLLGLVDVLASRIGAPPAESAWVVGTLEEDGDARWLHDQGRDAWYAVDAATVGAMEPSSLPRLARVRCDRRGVPTGPVVEVERPFEGDEAELLAWWRSRARRGR